MGVKESMGILFELAVKLQLSQMTHWHVPLLECTALKISVKIFPFLEVTITLNEELIQQNEDRDYPRNGLSKKPKQN